MQNVDFSSPATHV